MYMARRRFAHDSNIPVPVSDLSVLTSTLVAAAHYFSEKCAAHPRFSEFFQTQPSFARVQVKPWVPMASVVDGLSKSGLEHLAVQQIQRQGVRHTVVESAQERLKQRVTT